VGIDMVKRKVDYGIRKKKRVWKAWKYRIWN